MGHSFSCYTVHTCMTAVVTCALLCTVCPSSGGVLCVEGGGTGTGCGGSLQVSTSHLTLHPSHLHTSPLIPHSSCLTHMHTPPAVIYTVRPLLYVPPYVLNLPPPPPSLPSPPLSPCRKPGQASIIRNMVAEIDKGQFEFEEFGDIHTLGSLLKKFFQDLQDALIPGEGEEESEGTCTCM